MLRRMFFALLLIGLISVNAFAQTSKTTERRYALASHGFLMIQVPSDWKDQVKPPSDGMPHTITFSPGSGKPFQVLITPIWPTATKSGVALSRDEIRSRVERNAQVAKSQAVESQLSLKEIQGRSGSGFYFSATDRAPKPGEYKFLTQGIIRVGQLSVPFTILTNEGQELIVKQALNLIKSAAQKGN